MPVEKLHCLNLLLLKHRGAFRVKLPCRDISSTTENQNDLLNSYWNRVSESRVEAFEDFPHFLGDLFGKLQISWDISNFSNGSLLSLRS